MKVFKKAFLFILICLSLISNTSFASDASRRMSYHSVGKIAISYTKDKKDVAAESGSGFAIDEKHLITAGHLCKSMMLEITKGNTAEIFLLYLMQDGFVYQASGFKIKALDNETDLCMLESNKDIVLLPVELAAKDSLRIRDVVYTVGAPRGIFPIEAEGRIMTPRMYGKENKDKILCSLPIYGGNSGSPLFNENSEVVGVITAGDKMYQNVGYATNLTDLKKFIKKSLNKNE